MTILNVFSFKLIFIWDTFLKKGCCRYFSILKVNMNMNGECNPDSILNLSLPLYCIHLE